MCSKGICGENRNTKIRKDRQNMGEIKETKLRHVMKASWESEQMPAGKIHCLQY